MNPEISKIIRERGLLLEKEVYELVDSFDDVRLVREFLEHLEKVSRSKVITKSVLNMDVGYVKRVVSKLEGGREVVDRMSLGLVSIGVSKGVEERGAGEGKEEGNQLGYKVFYADTKPDKKIEVSDFTNHFRARFQQIQGMLMARAELQQGLVSIGKISSDRQSCSIIGIVSEKRATKNRNLIFKFEDLTGSINALVKVDRKEVFEKAECLQLDDIVGLKASGSREMLFIQDVFFPEAMKYEKVKFKENFDIGFLSDIHIGSNKHLKKEFESFLKWLNEDERAKKIRYLFIVGDNVDGVGVYPGQEGNLELKSYEEQYSKLAECLNRIPKRITIFMCPGQHDASRVAEPQPLINKRYARELYDIENLVLVTNPCMVKLIEGEDEFKVLMYHGGSIHHFINEIKELRLMKAHKTPARAVREMLKRRHLAPSHGVSPSLVYIPNAEKDPLVISEVPDVLCTGEVHRLDIDNYNGILILTGSCWQSQTDYEEKFGNEPDPCKVPVLNLKTRELKIYDFSRDDEN